MTKVTRTELIGVFAGWADLAILNDTETRIKDTVRDRLARLIGLISCNLHDTPLQNVVGVCDAELNSSDSVAHFTSYTVLCKVFVLGRKASVAFQKASSRTICSTISSSCAFSDARKASYSGPRCWINFPVSRIRLVRTYRRISRQITSTSYASGAESFKSRTAVTHSSII